MRCSPFTGSSSVGLELCEVLAHLAQFALLFSIVEQTVQLFVPFVKSRCDWWLRGLFTVNPLIHQANHDIPFFLRFVI